MSRVQIPRNKAQEAIGKANLCETLKSLKANGIIEKFWVTPYVVVIDGDLKAMELLVLSFDAHSEPTNERILNSRVDSRPQARFLSAGETAEYYRRAVHFLHRHRWKDSVHRAIWKMHSEGVSKRQIGVNLTLTSSKVYYHIRRLRQKAGLSHG